MTTPCAGIVFGVAGRATYKIAAISLLLAFNGHTANCLPGAEKFATVCDWSTVSEKNDNIARLPNNYFTQEKALRNSTRMRGVDERERGYCGSSRDDRRRMMI